MVIIILIQDIEDMDLDIVIPVTQIFQTIIIDIIQKEMIIMIVMMIAIILFSKEVIPIAVIDQEDQKEKHSFLI